MPRGSSSMFTGNLAFTGNSRHKPDPREESDIPTVVGAYSLCSPSSSPLRGRNGSFPRPPSGSSKWRRSHALNHFDVGTAPTYVLFAPQNYQLRSRRFMAFQVLPTNNWVPALSDVNLALTA